MHSSPRVSIGMAVRNGEAYIREALDSILAQTYTDFELIISDNASTDDTAAICLEYAERDSRIIYSRNPRNIGGTNNENLTITKARGEYFCLAAHDDKYAPTFLETGVAVLDRMPEIVICYCHVTVIDQNGGFVQILQYGKGTSMQPSRRLRELYGRDHYCEMTYGLMRLDVLRKTRLYKNYSDSDRTLLCELALRGRFYEVPEALFFKRQYPANQHIDPRERIAWFKPGSEGAITFPVWEQFFDMHQTVWRVPLPWADKARCLFEIGRWSTRHSLRMAKEVAINARMAAHSKEWRLKKHASVHNWE